MKKMETKVVATCDRCKMQIIMPLGDQSQIAKWTEVDVTWEELTESKASSSALTVQVKMVLQKTPLNLCEACTKKFLEFILGEGIDIEKLKVDPITVPTPPDWQHFQIEAPNHLEYKDKDNITNMPKECSKYCSYPEHISDDEAREFMKIKTLFDD